MSFCESYRTSFDYDLHSSKLIQAQLYGQISDHRRVGSGPSYTPVLVHQYPICKEPKSGTDVISNVTTHQQYRPRGDGKVKHVVRTEHDRSPTNTRAICQWNSCPSCWSAMLTLSNLTWLDACLAGATAYLVKQVLTKKNPAPYPPGPPAWPLIGNVLDMPSVRPWLTFADWGKKYGQCLLPC